VIVELRELSMLGEVKSRGEETYMTKQLSRQRQWQFRKKAQGLCVICGDTAIPTRKGPPSTNCEKHKAYGRDWRKRKQVIDLKVKNRRRGLG